MPNTKRVRVDPKRPKRRRKRGKGKSIKKSTWTQEKRTSGMDREIIDELAQDLSHRRSSLLQDVTESQDEMKAIPENPESELEESAQKDRITRLTSRLKERDRQKIREIDAALDRMTKGVYGKCGKCGQEIGIHRLRALPTTTLCINCAAGAESDWRRRTIGASPYARSGSRKIRRGVRYR